MGHRKLWATLVAVVVGSFAVLGWQGVELSNDLPPIPAHVVTTDGRVVVDAGSIMRGQNVWQSLGGQEIGSIWGHGAYVAPDWSADWLHRESTFVLDRWAGAQGLAALSAEEQAPLRARLRRLMRTNTFDAATETVTIDPVRAEAFEAIAAHYADVFRAGRDEYAIPVGTLTDAARMRDMAAFFWWTSWVTSTERPGDTVTYTQNWPHEPLVGNVPTAGNVMWSLASVVLLIAATGALVAYYARGRHDDDQVWQNLKFAKTEGWVAIYKWPILFFVAVAFWNLVGAGVFGFLINPPIALYYMQGLNLTPVHGHTALFGVYGMLGIGLMLFTLRALFPQVQWREKPIAIAFWSLNGGLAMMALISMLPIGVMQTVAAIEQGTWYARSAEFLRTPLMHTLRWLRAPGDTVFAVGIAAIAWFVIGLKTGWSAEPPGVEDEAEAPAEERAPAAVPSAARAHR